MKRPTHPHKNGRSRSTPEPADVIRLARRFSAPAEHVFRAWLDPDVAGRWLFATALHRSDANIDPRVGGSFRFAERLDGRRTEHAGRYLEIVPHRRLVFTLALPDRPRAVTRVTAEISPLRTGCELALTHEHVPPDRAHETEARWTGVLYGLGETLRAPRRRRSPS
jgi:uncharacterized protein YndB with AHSA1/START domain